MDMRYGYIRYAGGHIPRRLGFDWDSSDSSSEISRSSPKQLTSFPRSPSPAHRHSVAKAADNLNNDVHSFFVSFDKQHGTHNIKFGGDIRAYRDNDRTFGNATGLNTFGNDYTRVPSITRRLRRWSRARPRRFFARDSRLPDH